MKKIFTYLLLIQTLNLFSQTAFYDAVTISRYVSPNGKIVVAGPKKDTLLNILAQYKYIKGQNPFIDPFSSDGGGFSAQEVQPILATKNILPTVGNLNITTLADGLARFLVERTKEELNIAFFDRFKSYLDSCIDLKVLFPKTAAILLKIDNEIYNYKFYLPLLRESFNMDITQLGANFEDWLECDNCKWNKTINATDKSYIQLFLFLVRRIYANEHPGFILSQLSKKNFLSGIDKNLKASLLTINLISESLRAADFEWHWVSEKEFGIFKDLNFCKIYLGLLYLQSENIVFYKDNTPYSLQTIMKENLSKHDSLISVINYLKDQIPEIENAYEKGNFVLVSKKLVNIALHFSSKPAISCPQKSVDEDFNFYYNHTSQLFSYIQSKAYQSAVFESYVLLDKTIPKKQNFLKNYLRYGTFMASVINANDSKEVQAAIEAVSLPAGSSRIKREAPCNISLNAYVGFFAGNEYIKGAKNVNSFNSYGIAAPIGIAFSKGNIKCNKTNGGGKSITAFLSVIDIGALASFRFRDDSTTIVPDIKLKDILSPGFFLSYGFGKVPLSLSVGYQIGPILREVSAPRNTFADNKYQRLSISLTVDIPIFNLYTKPKY